MERRRDDHNSGNLNCSFCGKSQKEVKKLIAGPTVYICDECIGLCNDIIAEEVVAEADALVADVDRGTGNELFDFFLRLAAERAVQVAVLMVVTSAFQSLPR